jgi:hypothetical protein
MFSYIIPKLFEVSMEGKTKEEQFAMLTNVFLLTILGCFIWFLFYFFYKYNNHFKEHILNILAGLILPLTTSFVQFSSLMNIQAFISMVPILFIVLCSVGSSSNNTWRNIRQKISAGLIALCAFCVSFFLWYETLLINISTSFYFRLFIGLLYLFSFYQVFILRIERENFNFAKVKAYFFDYLELMDKSYAMELSFVKIIINAMSYISGNLLYIRLFNIFALTFVIIMLISNILRFCRILKRDVFYWIYNDGYYAKKCEIMGDCRYLFVFLTALNIIIGLF